MDYSGSAVLDKMHLYFSLEYLEIPLPLEELGRCFSSSFSVTDLADALVRPSGETILSSMRLHSLVGFHLGTLLEPAGERLRQWISRLEGYAAIEELVSSGPVFRIRVADLAQILGMGESTLSRNFHRDTGRTLKDYLKDQVIRRSKRALTGTASIKEIAADLGFDDEFYFSKFFKRETGFSPRAYRESLAEKLS
jgi:AraC-like DNA-binding protein